jgi:hypothetical protein
MVIGVSPVNKRKRPNTWTLKRSWPDMATPLFETRWNVSCEDSKPPAHGVKPLHLHMGKEHACKIREPTDAKN